MQDERQQAPAPKKPRATLSHVIAIMLIGIFAVLTLANLNAILSPLKTLSSILAPITIGLVLAYILNFFLRFFEYKLFNKIKKRTVNRALSMLFSYFLLLLILAGFVWLIIPNVIESVRNLQTNGLSYVARVIDSINALLDKLPIARPEDGSDFLNLEKLLTLVIELLGTSGSWIVSNISSIAGSTLTALKNIIVGIFISIYVLLSKERLNAGCRRAFRALFPEKVEKQLLHYFSTAHNKFGGYLIGKLADSFMVMLVCMVLFTIFNIPYPILIAVIIGVTDIIPFFGPFLGAIPSGVIIFIADPWKALVFALLILVVQQIDGNLIAPVILGDKTGLSSLGVIVAVTVMGGIFGITGMLIGVPLFALIMTLLDDLVKHRLKEKGHTTDLKEYYPADAFIRPQDVIKNDTTLTQRFVLWVRRVEDEELHTNAFSRGIRSMFLAIGRFFQRLFSVKPIPADHSGGIFHDIAKNGMHTNRLFWRSFLLSIVTLGIYPLYTVEVIAQSINLACRHDGKRTWGFVSFLLLSVITLGIFPLIWHCQVIKRMNSYLEENNKQPIISQKFYLCWTLIGFPILVGPLIAVARFLRSFSLLATVFNKAHTFPLSEDYLKEEIPSLFEEQKPRKSIIEQILETPAEALSDEEDAPGDEEYADEEPPALLSDEDEQYEQRSIFDSPGEEK